MRILITILFLFFLASSAGAQQTEVLICKGPTAYSYHSFECQGLRQCSAKTERVTLQEAKQLKRTPCGYCYKSSGRSYGGSSQSTASSQCAATTKKGSRCSRSVRSGSYCWQHGG